MFSSENLHRLDYIQKLFNYIVNQWSAIQRSINFNVSCSMEGCISSSIAYGFSSRPKAFSFDLLSNRLMLRSFYRNSFGNEDAFYKFLNSNTINNNNSNSNNFDFSIFDNLYKGDFYKLNLNINPLRL